MAIFATETVCIHSLGCASRDRRTKRDKQSWIGKSSREESANQKWAAPGLNLIESRNLMSVFMTGFSARSGWWNRVNNLHYSLLCRSEAGLPRQ